MDVAGFVHYGNAMIRVYSTAINSGDVGKTVTLVSKLHNKTYTKVFTSTQELVFEVDERDKYTITVTNTSSVVEFTTTVEVGFGSYVEIEVGMNKNTFRGIQNILNAHLEKTMLAIGDEISVTLTSSEVIVMQILAIDQDSAHQVIFGSKYCLQTGHNYNSACTIVTGKQIGRAHV